MRPKNWDQYEAALLLDYCLKVENKEMRRSEAVTTISKILRERAKRNGIEIDDTYRNENGISMQLSGMRSCFLKQKGGLTISKLFKETVELYKNNPLAFRRILREEYEEKNNTPWQRFLLWLQDEDSNIDENVESSLRVLSLFLMRNNQINKPIPEISDIKEIEQLQIALKSPHVMGFQSKKFARHASTVLGIYLRFLKTESKIDLCTREKSHELEHVSYVGIENQVDFSVDISYAHTKPTSCKYKGRAISCKGWNNLFISLTQEFYRESPDTFPTECKLSTGTRIDIGSKNGMINPKEISNNLYLECNVSATAVVNKLRALMAVCGLESSTVEIKYRHDGKLENSDGNTQKKSTWICENSNEISKLISNHFKYGFKLGDSLELLRLRDFAEQDGVLIPEKDDALEHEIVASGILIDGKIYVIQRERLEEVASLIDSAFESGAKVVFFESLMEKNAEWLEERHIANIYMLTELLKKVRPKYCYCSNFVTAGHKITEIEATVSEIYRVSGEQRVVLTRELEEILEFIPPAKIARSMSASSDFVWISEGKYFIMKHFVISKGDADEIYEYVSKKCDMDGYASVTNMPYGNVLEDNYDLSPSAMQMAIFNTVLKKDFYLNGKIITREADGTNISTILKDYISVRESCTVPEIMEKAFDLTGEQSRHKALKALYDQMIRVDKEHFVSEQQVYFDIDRVDELLSNFTGVKYSPIKGVTTFALFPPCGANWNHYLLESFCYRCSKQFRLEVIKFNDKNTGLIVTKELRLSYFDMLCDAAANAKIELTPQFVGNFFFENGYTAKRKFTKLPEIIKRAKSMREEA